MTKRTKILVLVAVAVAIYLLFIRRKATVLDPGNNQNLMNQFLAMNPQLGGSAPVAANGGSITNAQAGDVAAFSPLIPGNPFQGG